MERLRLDPSWTMEEICREISNWTGQLAGGGITRENIQTGAIVGGVPVTDPVPLAQETIEEENLQDESVATGKIQDLAITTAKIGDAAITAAKIEDATITNAKIANGTIENAKIKDATIESAKIKSIDTDVITVGDAAGKIQLSGDTLTVKDASANTRVLLGDVGSTNYGLEIRGSDGATILFDQTGITGNGIPNGTLTYDMLNQYLQNAVDFIAAGKAIYYQATEPSGGTYATGDLWFDTDDAYKVYEYDGDTSSWVARTDGSAAYYVTYMMASLINAGIITADKIQAGTISAVIAIAATLLVGGSGSSEDGIIQIKNADDNNIIVLDKNGQIVNVPVPELGTYETVVPFAIHDNLIDEDIFVFSDTQGNEFLQPNSAKASITLLSKQLTQAYKKIIYTGFSIIFNQYTSGDVLDYTATLSLKSSGKLQIGTGIVSKDVITGTSGTSGNLSAWNADGDLVDSGVPTPGAATAYNPVIAGKSTAGTFTYSTQEGAYFRIGKMVTATFTLVIDTVSGSPAGGITVSLPSTIKNQGSRHWYGASRTSGVSWGTSETNEVWIALSGESVVTLYGTRNGAAQAISDCSTLGNGDSISGTITYEEA